MVNELLQCNYNKDEVPDELIGLVGAGEKDDGNSDEISGRNLLRNRRTGREDELVSAFRNRSNKDRVENLIELGRLSGSDVDEVPLEVVGQVFDAVEGHFEFELR